MEIRFNLDDKEISKICKSEVELAASVVVRKMITNEQFFKNALTEGVKNIIKEELTEVSESDLRNIINAAIQKYTPEYINTYFNSTLSYMLADITKEVVYSEKQAIIDAVIKRASSEIYKRGLGKFFGEFTKIMNTEEEH